MRTSARWAIGILASVIILPLALWVAWETWRAHTLLAFCKEARVGMLFADFLKLERRHWIDDSYLVQSNFDGYIDQAHSNDLEFRSHMLDPDFACAVVHDGHTVKIVQLLTLEGFDP
jgi:hypothetical protein